MSFSSGTFTRLYNFVTDKANGIRVRADRMDAELDGFATGLSKAVLKDGTQTMTADLPMAGFKITGLGAPTASSDAVTKTYADALSTARRETVAAATTANGTLATAFANGQTVDGVTLATDDLILIKDQTDATANGVYVVQASGAPSRSTRFDAYSEFIGAIIAVSAGTANADTLWLSMCESGGTIGATDVTFSPSGQSIPIPVPIASGGTNATSESNAVKNLITGATAETTVATGDILPIYDLSETAGRKMTVENVLKGALGQQTIWYPASGMTSRTTNGPSSGSIETTTNAVNVAYLAFDTSTSEAAQFTIAMPKSWDLSTIICQVYWTHPATTTNFGVTWGIRAVAFANDDALDTAFGTAQEVSDTGGTTSDVYITAETSAMTVAGSPGAEELVVFEVYRDPADASDTMAVDAYLIGVKLHYTVSAVNDS